MEFEYSMVTRYFWKDIFWQKKATMCQSFMGKEFIAL